MAVTLILSDIMTEELIELAKKHPGFREVSDYGLRVMFETYKNTTLIQRDDDGKITAFAIYQEWPDCLNFIAVVGASGDRGENVRALLKILGRKNRPSPGKEICYFDEVKMELKVICHSYRR